MTGRADIVPRPARRRALLTLTIGHACSDLCSSALWALLPFLVVERHYSYAAVGVFALVSSVASGVVQPLAGAWGDRGQARWLPPAGLVLAGLGIAVVGFTVDYPMTLVAAVVCSLGVGAYHPEGARWARYAAGSRVTANMSVFSVGGGVGYALGPLVVAVVLAPLGLHGTPLIAVVPFVAAAAVVVALRRLHANRPQGDHHAGPPPTASEWRPFVVLLAVFCVGNGVTSGLFTFVPLFLVEVRGTSPGTSNVMSSVLLGSAAAGTLLGGIAAQRYGRRIVLLAPQLALAAIISFLPGLGYAAMVPVVVLTGVAMNANMSLGLVLSQEYLPLRMGLATGLLIGLCGGVGGVIVAGLGLLGDAAGPAAVLYAIAVLPLRRRRPVGPAAAPGGRAPRHALEPA